MMRDSGSLEALQSLQEIDSERYQDDETNPHMNMIEKNISPADSLGQTMTKLKFSNMKPERLPKAPVSRGFPKGKILKTGPTSGLR
jgi:hypothetical protein